MKKELNVVEDFESSEDEHAKEKRVQKEIMEQDGFTLVTPDDLNPSRIKVRDSLQTTVIGVSQEEAWRQHEAQQARRAEKDEQKYVSGQDSKSLIKRDFYMFQKKLGMKSDLEKLKEGFEQDKKRLQKAMEKSKKHWNLIK